ncbi:MAG: anti-sigma factor [Pyrinomonadaceae bacterium]
MRTRICAKIQEELPLYVGGELQAQSARRIAEHVRDCADCLMSADQLQAMREDVRLYAAHPPPSMLDERVFAEIRSAVLGEIRKPPRRYAIFTVYSRVRPFRLALAASLALLLLSATLLLTFTKKAQQVEESAEESTRPLAVAVASAVPPRVENYTSQTTATTQLTEKVKGRRRPTVRATRKAAPSAAVERSLQTDSVSVSQTGTPAPYQLLPPKMSVAVNESVDQTDQLTEPEQLRIELQTKDPDVRIIWLSLKTRE